MTIPQKAIFISAIDYESPIQIGDHQLARQFALHGWKIAFLSKPITPFHLLSRKTPAISRRMKNYFSHGEVHRIGEGEIWSYVPGAFIIPKNTSILRNEIVYHYWHLSILPNLHNILTKEGFEEVDLIYIRDPIQGYLLDVVRHKYAIFRIADNDAEFFSNNKGYSEIESRVAKKVDSVIYSAKELEHYVQNLTPKKSYLLPNGVDYNHFASADKSPPLFYNTIKHPIIVYAGSIDYWFDFDLISQLAIDLPEFSFVIIGPNDRNKSRFKPSPNLFLMGSIDFNDLPGYLSNAEIGIIPFNLKEYPRLVDSISPIKLFEYMACGLPVVAPKWKELRNINSPAILCNSYIEFLDAITKNVKRKFDKSIYEEFAAQNDWSFRYQELLNLINNSAK